MRATSCGVWHAGPVPSRVDGPANERLLKLICDAVAAGWVDSRACEVLSVGDVRVHRWHARLREQGTLLDGASGGNPTDRLVDGEQAAVLERTRRPGSDRGLPPHARLPRQLHRRCVSPSTVLRAAAQHRLDLT